MDKKTRFAIKIFSLLILLAFPSVLYIVLSKGKHNFNHLQHFGPKELDASGDTIFHSVAPFSFTNQYGETISDKDLEGKIYVADYFFTTCQSICPKMSTLMLDVQTTFEGSEEVVLLSHTVNPEEDSIPVLLEYSGQVHAKKGKWHFLTGNKKELYDLARHSYFLTTMEGDGGPDDFIHSEKFILVDKEKNIRGIYDGTSKAEVNKLIDEIKVLQAEYLIPKKIQ